MIIQLEEKIKAAEKDAIVGAVDKLGYKPQEVKTQKHEYLVCIGKKEFDIRSIGSLPGVEDVHRVSDDFKFVSRKWKASPTVINIGNDVQIKEGDFSIMAGPCSIEGEEQIKSTIEHLKKNNVKIMRGGVYKPRSSPYSFRGMGMDGLKTFYKLAKANGIKIITEVMDRAQIEPMYEYIDIFQIGARNSQNFDLLDELGKVDKPILLKRGISGTIDELLQSAEYIFSAGNERLLLCERGIRTYEKAYRNTFDINAIPILKEKTHLPVIIDPSHGIGLRDHVTPIALAGTMAGADGIIIEVHEKPEEAFSDGQQTLSYHEAEKVYQELRATFELREKMKTLGDKTLS